MDFNDGYSNSWFNNQPDVSQSYQPQQQRSNNHRSRGGRGRGGMRGLKRKSDQSRPVPTSSSLSDVSTTGQQRSGAKKPAPSRTGLQNAPKAKYFPVFTSNFGVTQLAEIVYRTLIGRDFKLATSVTQLQLEYVLTIAFINRVVQCAITTGTNLNIPEASRLKQVSKGINLPGVLVKYIESIGTFCLQNGATVIPQAGGYRQMFPLDSRLVRDPLTILREAGRNDQGFAEWPIDTDWIEAWNQSTTRQSRLGMKFSTVGDTIEGRVEMVCSYRIDNDAFPSRIECFAPQDATEVETRLGSVYAFRNVDELQQWPGGNKPLVFHSHTAGNIEPHQFFADVCVSSFTEQ